MSRLPSDEVVGIPQRARRTIAPKLHGAGRVVAKLPALWVVMHREDIKQAFTRGQMMLPQLIEQPRQVIPAAVAVAIRKIAPAMQAAVLLIVSAQRVSAPIPIPPG